MKKNHLEYFKRHFFLSIKPPKDVVKFFKLQEKFSSSNYYKIFKTISVEELKKISEKKALSIFWKAARNVPAYQHFLKKNKIKIELIKGIKDFSKVPIINKQNYLTQYSRADLSWDGKTAGVTMMSMSSGTTGHPYYWPRTAYLEYETTLTYELMLFQLGVLNKKTLVIDAYSMGIYVAGTFTLNSLREIGLKYQNICVISPGLEVEVIIRAVKDLGKNFEYIVIAGYPPFVKDILDQGKRVGVSWREYKLKFIFGAENFSEQWRKHIYDTSRIFSRDYLTASLNTYGSADCAILGHETPLTIALRKRLSTLKNYTSLLDVNYLPTIVQFNPLLRYFECLEGKLVFTANGGIPLVKYDIGDNGRIYWKNESNNTLQKSIILQKIYSKSPFKNLPILTLFGRKSNTVTLYGLNIYPEHIKYALESRKIHKYVTGKFKLKTETDPHFNQHLIVYIELMGDYKLNGKVKDLIIETIIRVLKNRNFEFSRLLEKIGRRAMPKVFFLAPNSFRVTTSKHKWTIN